MPLKKRRLAKIKKQEHFSLPGYQLTESLDHVFGFYETTKKNINK